MFVLSLQQMQDVRQQMYTFRYLTRTNRQMQMLYRYHFWSLCAQERTVGVLIAVAVPFHIEPAHMGVYTEEMPLAGFR